MKKLIMIVTALMLSGMMFAQEYHWTAPNSSLYDYRNHITAQVKIDGVFQASDAIEIAAFIGDEVRGVIRLLEPYPVGLPGQYYTYLTIFANQPEIGQTITLKAFDHDTGTEYGNCQQTFEFSGAEEYHYGGIETGLYLEFVSEQILPFGPDYPWIQSSSYSGNGMALTAQIQIDGELVDRATWEVGAFCDNECRGDKTPLTDWTDFNMGYFVDMNILGNNGDIIDFYLYDTEAGAVLRAKCFTTVELVNDTYIGQDVFNDLFVLNFVTEQSFTIDIAAYSGNGGYYLIASPIGESDPAGVENMLANDFDLYYFDQSQDLEWINYEAGAFNLVAGKGYLYANSEDVTLKFTGAPYSGNGEVALVKDDNANLSGWNLVGNPFAQTAYVTKAFYTMNGDGSEVIAGTGNSVEPMEGIFVIAETDGEVMTFSTEAPQSKDAALVMNVSRNRGNAIDRAIVRFGEESILPKFTLNRNSTKLYIPQSDKDYAVVSANSDMGEMPVNFKTAENGTYTLNFNAKEVSFSYLHLIDNLTGADVNLLDNPSYTFQAKSTDYASRFKLVFVTGSNSNNDNFAFFSNGSFVINNEGEATLQIVDVMGRIIKSETINGCANVSLNAAPGVYVFNLVNGNNIRTQKIVVE